MSTANLDSADLKAASGGGVIAEDVMAKIWDISKIPLPLTEMISETNADQEYTEWTEDELAAVSTSNKVVDGADIDQNNTVIPSRVGNHGQISVKEVKVSSRAESSKSFGGSGKLAYQVMRRQQELFRDIEAQILTQQASVADNGDAVAGQSGGLGAWIKDNVDFGATGSAGGFNSGTKLVDAPTAGTVRGLTETLVRDHAQEAWEDGGNPSILMSTPLAIRNLSQYMFSSSANIATLQSDAGQSKMGALTAMGSVNVFITDFGVTLRMIPNRLQQTVTTNNVTVFIIDPEMISLGVIRGARVEELGKSGLSTKRMMSKDYTLKVYQQKAHAAIHDINPATAVVA